MRQFEIGLGECSKDAHCYFGMDERCRCGTETRSMRKQGELNSLRAECDAALAEVERLKERETRYERLLAGERECAKKDHEEIEKLKGELAERSKRSDIWMRSDLQARDYANGLERQLAAAQAEVSRLRAALERVREIECLGFAYQTQEDLIAGLEHIRNEVGAVARAALAEGEGK